MTLSRWLLIVLMVLVVVLNVRVQTSITTAHRNAEAAAASKAAAVSAQAAADQAKVASNRAADAAKAVQAGVDELVAFVHQVEAEPNQSAGLVTEMLTILCASTDPLRTAACAAYGLPAHP